MYKAVKRLEKRFLAKTLAIMKIMEVYGRDPEKKPENSFLNSLSE